MKKKLFACLTVCVMTLICALSFTACGDNGGNGGNNDGTHTQHNWSPTYIEDGDRHYQTCSGCNEKQYSSHSYNSDGVCVCGKRNPEQGGDPAVLKGISESFSKAMATYSGNDILDENGVKKTFSEMLDRQFDVLAEDILYRLYVTYGENTYGEQSTFGDLTLNGGNYGYNGNSAKVVKNTLLTNATSHSSNHDYENIDCIKCYQGFIQGGLNYNRLSNREYVRLDGALTGKFTNFDGRNLTADNNFDRYWHFNDYSKWNMEYREQFKLALAKIVYGNEQTTLTYSELLNKINRLGFTAANGEKIVAYINNSVIGTNLIAENLRIYNTFSESDKSNIKNWTNPDEIEKHYFKGYNIVVPAIVSQALANTFDGTVGLYPSVNKQVNSSFEFDGFKTERDYKQIVLMPKNSDVLVTKISAKFYSGSSQNKTVTVKATVKNAAGVLVSEKSVGTVTLTSAGTAVEFDIGCINTIGIYTGDLTSSDTLSLFGNNAVVNLGDNYVELTFEYEDGVTFGIEFLGMYDK